MGGTTTLALTGARLLKSKKGAKTANDGGAARAYQLRMNEVARQQAADAKDRQDTLLKASAAQRARFAAQGVGVADGSSGAVLDGMRAKTTQELNDQAAAYGAKSASIQNSFSQTQASYLTPSKNNRKASQDYLIGENGTLQKLKDWD